MKSIVRWFGLGAVVLLVAPTLLGQPRMPGTIVPLGVQSCDTECQSRETDCDLACDQVVACVEECKKSSAACVERCRTPAPPQKPADSADPPTSPVAPPPDKGKKPDGKPPAVKPEPAKPPATKAPSGKPPAAP